MVTPVKYDCDSKDLINTFCKVEVESDGKINEQHFSTPHAYSAGSNKNYNIKEYNRNLLIQ